MSTDLACCFCPADRFPNRARLNEHLDDHRVAELAARPADPLAVLREALVWAEDAGLLRLAPDDVALIDVTRLVPGKPIPGYPVSLFGRFNELSIRVAIADRASGPALVVHLLYRDGTSIKLRRALPAQFAVKPAEIPTREAA